MFAKVSKIRAKQVSHLAEFHWFLPIMFIISTFSICIYFWLCWVFVAVLMLSLAVGSRGCWLVVMQGLVSVVASLVVGRRL